MLSPEQIKQRKGRFTGTCANTVMSGDPARIIDLWREMTEAPDWLPLDFEGVWPVQLGIATEELNLRWAERKYGSISRKGAVVLAFDPEWAAVTLDGWLDDHKVPIECKHVGGREPYEVVVERYQPQLQWTCMVTDARECAFSVIVGANEPIVEFIPRDVAYITDHLLPRATQFMQHVRDRTPPVDMPTVTPPTLIKKTYDMHAHPVWIKSAAQWIQTHGAADTAKEHEKILKALVPEDAKICTGCGIRISRDRAGRLSLREDA